MKWNDNDNEIMIIILIIVNKEEINDNERNNEI